MKSTRLNPRRPFGMCRVSGAGFLAGLACALLASLSGAAQARGKLVDLHGAVLAGAMTGRGSDSATPDLYHQTEGGGLGLELGARLLILDFSMRFLQMVNTGGSGGTMLSALLGPSVEIPVLGGGQDAEGKQLPPRLVISPGLAGGVTFGSLVPVDPPLTNDQLAGKGLILMGRFAVERMYGPILGVGAEIQGGYHYLVGASGVANGKDHSSGWQLGAFATLAFHLGV
ncbi:MAG: hypothetical protein H7X95_02265 [Deltaproteobacteria bacterium]|nr:hypothetical protein [Deltaproteobacteria bacterium]